METEILKNYLIGERINIDKVIDDFYDYVYVIVKNAISICITNEDIEEIMSDVFVAIWRNSANLSNETALKPYLAGIAKNVIKNKYRKTKLDFSMSDYEESLVDNCNIQEITEENEQDKIIQSTLKTLKNEEYKIFIMFYYEAKTVKWIAEKLNISISKVKTTLHRIRKIIKKNLEDGGYGYGK